MLTGKGTPQHPFSSSWLPPSEHPASSYRQALTSSTEATSHADSPRLAKVPTPPRARPQQPLWPVGDGQKKPV